MRTRLRGYNRHQVDEFLGRCLASGINPALDEELVGRDPHGQPVTAAEVRDVLFSTALRGYDQFYVDELLDRIASALS